MLKKITILTLFIFLIPCSAYAKSPKKVNLHKWDGTILAGKYIVSVSAENDEVLYKSDLKSNVVYSVQCNELRGATYVKGKFARFFNWKVLTKGGIATLGVFAGIIALDIAVPPLGAVVTGIALGGGGVALTEWEEEQELFDICK